MDFWSKRSAFYWKSSICSLTIASFFLLSFCHSAKFNSVVLWKIIVVSRVGFFVCFYYSHGCCIVLVKAEKCNCWLLSFYFPLLPVSHNKNLSRTACANCWAAIASIKTNKRIAINCCGFFRSVLLLSCSSCLDNEVAKTKLALLTAGNPHLRILEALMREGDLKLRFKRTQMTCDGMNPPRMKWKKGKASELNLKRRVPEIFLSSPFFFVNKPLRRALKQRGLKCEMCRRDATIACVTASRAPNLREPSARSA